MKRVSFFLTASVAGVVACASSASAQLAFWHMNDTTDVGTSLFRLNDFGTAGNETTYERDVGTIDARISVWGGGIADGTLSGTNGGATSNNFGSFSGTTSGDMGFGAGGSLSIVGTDNNTQYFTIAFDTAESQIELSYWTRGTGTGYTTHTISYSTDGGSTINLLTSFASNQTSTYSEKIVNFGGVFGSSSGVNQNIIYVAVSGATGTSGNNRFDNILLTPEPGTVSLLALSALALCRRRRIG